MRVYLALVLAPLWLGCGDGAGDGPAEGAGVTLLGDCERPEGEAFEGRVLFAGTFGGCQTDRVPEALTVVDEDGWEALRADVVHCAEAPPEPLDLTAEYAVAVGVAVGSTCGLEHPRLTLVRDAPGPWVELALTDRSAGCPIVCPAVGSWVTIVAVPRDAGEPPRLCRRVDHGCP